jgi:ankyrin repeat protein
MIDPAGGMHKEATDLHYGLLSEQIRDGAYPLHMAIHSGVSFSILELLIQQAPEDVLTKTNKFGETPLHLALKKGAHNEPQIELLLRHDTKAVTMRDCHGNLPLHNAAAFGCSPVVAKHLMEVGGPDMIHAVNSEGLTPMACAIQHNHCSKEVLGLLSIKDFLGVCPTECKTQ